MSDDLAGRATRMPIWAELFIASGEKISISVEQEYEIALRLNYSGSCPVQHREKLVPSIRKIWL